MDLTRNYFDIFGLAPGFDLDLKGLAERYRDLQKEFHPDRYASQSSSQQKLAVQYTAFINQAFTTLKSPVSRAQYLLEQLGVDGKHENTTVDDPEFLMSQMMLRESLAEVHDAQDPFAALEIFAESANQQFTVLQADFSEQYADNNLDNAVATVAKMQFYQKLLAEVEQLEEELDS